MIEALQSLLTSARSAGRCGPVPTQHGVDRSAFLEACAIATTTNFLLAISFP